MGSVSLLRLWLGGLGALIGLALVLPVVALGLPFWGLAALTRAVRGGVLSLSSRLARRQDLGGFARLIHPVVRRLARRPIPWKEMMRFEPTVGWRPSANLDEYGMADCVFHLTTDEEGWRGKTNLADANVVVFGDSFAFGHGQDDETFFAELPSDVKIKAVGANGYSMVPGLLWMERLAAELRGKLVVWFIYYGNDLYENLQPNLGAYRMPFVRSLNGSEEWEIVTQHVSEEPWPFPAPRNYRASLGEICTPSLLSRRVFGACRFLISRGRRVCEEVGAHLVVMGIPPKWQLSAAGRRAWFARVPDPDRVDPERVDRELDGICRTLGVPFVTLTDYLSPADYKKSDSHWNGKGHRRVAELLGRIHSEFMCDPHLAELRSRDRSEAPESLIS